MQLKTLKTFLEGTQKRKSVCMICLGYDFLLSMYSSLFVNKTSIISRKDKWRVDPVRFLSRMIENVYKNVFVIFCKSVWYKKGL